MFDELKRELDSIMARDPAARSQVGSIFSVFRV